MAKSSVHPSKASSSSLPSYTERAPKLLDILEETANRMENLPEIASYLPNWEPLYDHVHSLKGLVKIIECSSEQQEWIIQLSTTLGAIAVGAKAVRNGPQTAVALRKIRELISQDKDPAKGLALLDASCSTEFEHKDRLKKIPRPIENLSDFASKRAFEIEKFQFPSKSYTEIIRLEKFPDWHRKLESAVRGNDQDRRGLLVACLPKFEADLGKDEIRAWAWVAPGRPGDESVFQRAAAAIPNAVEASITE